MSGFSSPEFLLIVVLALVVLGPKRLPEIANKIGGWVGQARRMTRVMRRQLEEELNVEDLNQIGTPLEKEREAVTEIDEPRPDHIPNEDDSFSPLHAEEDDDEDDSSDKPT
jgi:sec-independent protein translocase protein TatB